MCFVGVFLLIATQLNKIRIFLKLNHILSSLFLEQNLTPLESLLSNDIVAQLRYN